MKKFLIAVIILILIFSGVVVYLNQVFLPQKIKSLVVTGLAKQTGKTVSLKSLHFSVFSGLVLQDLVISDKPQGDGLASAVQSQGQQVILSVRRANCSVFILPIFKKQVIIPQIYLKAPYIYLERRPDNTFNLQEMFKPAPGQAKAEFSFAVFKLVISNGNITFVDNALPNLPKKELKNIQLTLNLGLPVKLKFNFSAQLSGQPATQISASGEYKILAEELLAQVQLKDLSTAEIGAYYPGIAGLVSGSVDLELRLKLKDKLLALDFECGSSDLSISKDKISAKLDLGLTGTLNYGLETKQLSYNASADIQNGQIHGIEAAAVKNINGKLIFNQQSLASDNLQLELFGQPFKIKLNIADFKDPALDINTGLDLGLLVQTAKDKFKFSLVDSADGKGSLFIRLKPDDHGQWQPQGSLIFSGARIKLNKIEEPVTDAGMHLKFNLSGLSWASGEFSYKGIDYQTSGRLADFSSPQVSLKLDAQGLSVSADFNLVQELVHVNQLKGTYLNSRFDLSGKIDRKQPDNLRMEISGKLGLELKDVEKFAAGVYPAVKNIAPSGNLDLQFNFSGAMSDLENCYLEAKASAREISFYGLKAQNLTLDYVQEDKLARVISLNGTFYEGVVAGSGAVNLKGTLPVYHLELTGSGIKLEQLKMDTASRAKEIAGIFSGQLRLDGQGTDLAALNGAGNFNVTKGRLGGLNLLHGLGSLLLSEDLGKVEFTGASSDFLVKDSAVSTQNFKVTSVIVNLEGPVSVGFDNALNGHLNVDVISEMIPIEGTFRDVTTAIIGQGPGKFGSIKLSGTLQEPKYSFRTDVTNIIQGLANVFLKK